MKRAVRISGKAYVNRRGQAYLLDVEKLRREAAGLHEPRKEGYGTKI